MGMWDVTAFGNDYAADWALELQDAVEPDLLLEREFRQAMSSAYLELDACHRVVAGASIIAAAATGYVQDVPAYVLEWIQGKEIILTPLHSLATAALARVREGPSELIELLRESDSFGPWKQTLDVLMARLKPAG